MNKKRMIRNDELVDVYYDENGEEIFEHWVHGVRASSGRFPFPGIILYSSKSAHENAHGN